MPDSNDEQRRSGELSDKGYALHAEGKLEEALQILQEALQLDPLNDAAHANLASVLFDQDKYADALVSIRRALELNPDDAISFNTLGVVLRGLGKYPEAVAAHERALRLRPDYPNGYYNLALALVDADRLPEAATACEAAVTLKPGSVGRFRELVYIYEKLERPKDVEAALRRGFASTDDALLGYSLGHFLAGRKRWAEAADVLSLVIQKDSSFAKAHVELGYVLVEMGSVDEGIAHQLEALRIDSSDEQAKLNLYLARKKRASQP